MSAADAFEIVARRSATMTFAVREAISEAERITTLNGEEHRPDIRSAVAWIAGHLHQHDDPAMAELFDELLQVTA
jgi:hypothetical protein